MRRFPPVPVIVAALALVLAVVASALFANSCGDRSGAGSSDGVSGSDRISFAAVGDVISSGYALEVADAAVGKKGDDTYDFKPFYSELKPFLQQYDLRFVNEECVADPTIPVSEYPAFNAPSSFVDALADASFNIVNFNSNHSWDFDAEGIEHTRGVLASHPEFTVIGSYESSADREQVRVIERNGSKIAFLSYCYGMNDYDSTRKVPNDYYTCLFDKSTMETEIARAKEVADAVVVYMHWGTEYESQPDAKQLEYARFLADQGVDLVIGSHTHGLQPIRYVEGSSGNKVPVVFGLSDFVSGWTITDTIFSGVFTCDFVWNDGKLGPENLQFYPAIEFQAKKNGPVYVRLLKDMTDADFKANLRTEDVEDDKAHLKEYLANLEMEIPIVWE